MACYSKTALYAYSSAAETLTKLMGTETFTGGKLAMEAGKLSGITELANNLVRDDGLLEPELMTRLDTSMEGVRTAARAGTLTAEHLRPLHTASVDAVAALTHRVANSAAHDAIPHSHGDDVAAMAHALEHKLGLTHGHAH